MTNPYDYIIVGGGSAGCVLANRLSSDLGCSVLLLEAGEDTPPDGEPADILDVYPLSSYNSSYFWPNLKAFWRNDSSGSAVSFPQARVMGGGSSVAGMVAFRGTPDDYQEWEAAGAHGWSWPAVLPYFRKLETDQDFTGPLHGSAGPIPIRRVPRELWPPLTLAIERYAHNAGLPYISDMNADFREGFGATPISSTTARRMSAAAGYLTSSVRQRSNLHIESGAMVRSLRMSANRVIGVVADVTGKSVDYRAREVIVAAGAIHSPALLLRSGIGDADALQAMGIKVAAHRPGVGRNLRNHAALFIGAILRRKSRQDPSLRTHPTACMRVSSGLPGAPKADLYINLQSKTSWNAVGAQLASLNAVLLKPAGTGQVRLTSAHANQPPAIQFGFGEDAGDVERLAQLVIRIVDVLQAPDVAEHVGRPFVVRVGDRIRNWNALSSANAVKARAFAAILDLMPRGVADTVVARLTGDVVDLASLCAQPDALLDFVRREVSGVYHPVGTCRMGRPDDVDAVVDPSGRVIGMQGLRVVDASIMPTIPRGNTNIPTIMLAEKLSDEIVRGGAAK